MFEINDIVVATKPICKSDVASRLLEGQKARVIQVYTVEGSTIIGVEPLRGGPCIMDIRCKEGTPFIKEEK